MRLQGKNPARDRTASAARVQRRAVSFDLVRETMPAMPPIIHRPRDVIMIAKEGLDVARTRGYFSKRGRTD